VADDPAAAALGKALFEDAGLSPSGKVSCASCHDPTKQLSDARPRAVGAAEGTRRTPTIALAAHARWQTWDGRADTLWAQALGPLEEPTEMDGSRLFAARRVLTAHAAKYAEAFPDGPRPDLSKLPLQGKPGQASFDGMGAEDRESVTRVFVNAGKAIAAYERTFRVTESRLDAYVTGNRDALSPLEKLGLSTLVHVGCMQCHWGPRLTDDAFHNTRAVGGAVADRGRLDGVARLQKSEFLATSAWSDDRSARDVSGVIASPSLLGAFKTRTLRAVAKAAPFGHAGAAEELSTVTETYGTGGLPAGDPRAVGVAEPWVAPFGVTSQWALVPFLETLTEAPIVP
jgi:cytochrome c peroxidase